MSTSFAVKRIRAALWAALIGVALVIGGVGAPAMGAGVAPTLFSAPCVDDQQPPDCELDPPTQICGDGSEIPADQTCPPPTVPCWDGSMVYDAANCPAQPVPMQNCADGSVIPADQACPPVVVEEEFEEEEEAEVVAPPPPPVVTPTPTPTPTPTAVVIPGWQPPFYDGEFVSSINPIAFGALMLAIVALLAFAVFAVIRALVLKRRRTRAPIAIPAALSYDEAQSYLLPGTAPELSAFDIQLLNTPLEPPFIARPEFIEPATIRPTPAAPRPATAGDDL